MDWSGQGLNFQHLVNEQPTTHPPKLQLPKWGDPMADESIKCLSKYKHSLRNLRILVKVFFWQIFHSRMNRLWLCHAANATSVSLEAWCCFFLSSKLSGPFSDCRERLFFFSCYVMFMLYFFYMGSHGSVVKVHLLITVSAVLFPTPVVGAPRRPWARHSNCSGCCAISVWMWQT